MTVRFSAALQEELRRLCDLDRQSDLEAEKAPRVTMKLDVNADSWTRMLRVLYDEAQVAMQPRNPYFDHEEYPAFFDYDDTPQIIDDGVLSGRPAEPAKPPKKPPAMPPEANRKDDDKPDPERCMKAVRDFARSFH